MTEKPIIPVPSYADMAQSGVYFLHLSGEIVYVGKAVDMRRRLGNHISEGFKEFDAVSYLAVAVDKLDAVEQLHIRRLTPRYNRCAVTEAARALNAVAGRHVYEEWLSAAETADLLGIDEQTLKAMTKEGAAPRSRRLPRCKARKYDPGEVRAMAARKAA